MSRVDKRFSRLKKRKIVGQSKGSKKSRKGKGVRDSYYRANKETLSQRKWGFGAPGALHGLLGGGKESHVFNTWGFPGELKEPTQET